MAGSPKTRAKRLAKKVLAEQGGKPSQKDFNKVYANIRKQQLDNDEERLVAKARQAQSAIDAEKAKMAYTHLLNSYSLDSELDRIKVEIQLALDKYAKGRDRIKAPKAALEAALQLVKILNGLSSNNSILKDVNSEGSGSSLTNDDVVFEWASWNGETVEEDDAVVEEDDNRYEQELQDTSTKLAKAEKRLSATNRKLLKLQADRVAEAKILRLAKDD